MKANLKKNLFAAFLTLHIAAGKSDTLYTPWWLKTAKEKACQWRLLGRSRKSRLHEINILALENLRENCRKFRMLFVAKEFGEITANREELPKNHGLAVFFSMSSRQYKGTSLARSHNQKQS